MAYSTVQMTGSSANPPLLTGVAMTVTFVSEAKKFAFAARHDTGESVYVSPMLAEQVELDRKSAGRVLTATIAANADDVGSATSTPWRVMSWEIQTETSPRLIDSEVTALRACLHDALTTLDKLRTQLEAALKKLD